MESSNANSLAVLIAARNEADVIADTIRSLREAFPGAALWVADDASDDGTSEAAMAAGAKVVRRGKSHGKGGNVTACAEAMLSDPDLPELVLLCDGDLAGSAGDLAPLVDAVRIGDCDLAVAMFARRVGGGFGFALGFSAWAIRNRCGAEPQAPISGQRAMRLEVLRAVLPFAPSYGMETGMTIDAVRAGYRLGEYEIDLAHKATGKSFRGFVHRFRQLIDFARVWWSRRGGRGPDGKKPARSPDRRKQETIS
ncbi:MAG: glycosyltransferase [Solirubrobacterales bacterium]|nr:glycosyltransferase [Solirubrobacterales bacterium]HRV60193.1 glycosyltransferase [Solirubrobacterales bacterium]